MSTSRCCFIGILALIISLPSVIFATELPPKTTASFLHHAAEDQQQDIALGQLAMQKAENEQVKQFGARMVADHQKAHQEVQQLALKGGLQLSSQPNESHAQIKHQLAQLSGKEFDRAYMTAMVREHAQEIKELEQHARAEKNQEVRQWVASAIPVVQEHLTKATTIASSLGISAGAPTK